MRKKIILINNDGQASYSFEPEYNCRKKLDSINLDDKDGNSIFVGDILYSEELDTYFTVFEMPGGYCIESNPRSFGLYSENDPIPCVESTANPQTADFIRSSCKVTGNRYINIELYDKIRSEYENSKVK